MHRSRALSIVLIPGLVLTPATFAATIPLGEEVTAVFTPQTLAVLPGESQTAVLILDNHGATPITAVSVVSTASSGRSAAAASDSSPDAASVRLDATVSGAPTEVPAGGSAAIDVTITLNGTLPSQATVVTAVEFTSSGVKRALVATLAVTQAAWPTAAPGPLTLTASASSDALVQYQSGDLLFTLQNTSVGALELSAVIVTAPVSLQVIQIAPEHGDPEGSPPTAENGRLVVQGIESLASGSSEVVHLRLTARNQIQPGNALVTLSVRYTDTATHAPGFTTAGSTIALSVFGESVILQLLAVPALFVVPGLILVVVLWLLWTRVHPARRTPAMLQGPLGIATTVLLWILILTPSLLFPYLYQWVTDLIGAPRDYRASYGFEDIVGLWLLAVAVGALMWFAAITIRALFLHFFLLLPGDEAIDVLRKLALRIRPNRFTRPTAMYKPAAPTRDQSGAAARDKDAATAVTERPASGALVPTVGKPAERIPTIVETDDAGTMVYVLRYRPSLTLVCPPINFSGGETEVDEARALQGRPWRLYRHLRKRGNHMSVEYQASDTINRPTDVSDDQLFETGSDWIVRKAE